MRSGSDQAISSVIKFCFNDREVGAENSNRRKRKFNQYGSEMKSCLRGD